MKIKLSVVIPAYNEEINIRLGALDKVLRYLEKQKYAWELIVVDDGSTDQTNKLLSELGKPNHNIMIISNPHKGKAATVITGMLSASGEIVLFSDLDQATPINQTEKILPWFDKDYDIVIGSRNSRREGAPLLRLLMARGFMMLRNLILGMPGITDTQCGFKAFKKYAAKDLFSKLKLYGQSQRVSGAMVTAGFDIELIFLAIKNGYRVKEVPVEWHYVDTRRVSPVKDSISGFMDILRIRWNQIKGAYN